MRLTLDSSMGLSPATRSRTSHRSSKTLCVKDCACGHSTNKYLDEQRNPSLPAGRSRAWFELDASFDDQRGVIRYGAASAGERVTLNLGHVCRRQGAFHERGCEERIVVASA
jgi:hypothetical protein